MKDLILLPGWGFDAHVWQPVAERLTDDFRISYDLDAAPAGAILCGWSLGAIRAMQHALAQPGRISGLILVGATPRFTQAPDWPHAQPQEILDAFAAAVAADPRAARRRFAALMNQGDDKARQLTRDLPVWDEAAVPPANLAAGLEALRDTDLRDEVAAIALPVLLVHGERDPLMPLVAPRWLAKRLPNARLEVFAGAAHAPFLADPDRFAELVAAFAHE